MQQHFRCRRQRVIVHSLIARLPRRNRHQIRDTKQNKLGVGSKVTSLSGHRRQRFSCQLKCRIRLILRIGLIFMFSTGRYTRVTPVSVEEN